MTMSDNVDPVKVRRVRSNLNLNDAGSGAHKYTLQLESRELRKEAQPLQKRCDFDMAEFL